jgi:hypothetical protein
MLLLLRLLLLRHRAGQPAHGRLGTLQVTTNTSSSSSHSSAQRLAAVVPTQS